MIALKWCKTELKPPLALLLQPLLLLLLLLRL
jgi:hypothetical protein